MRTDDQYSRRESRAPSGTVEAAFLLLLALIAVDLLLWVLDVLLAEDVSRLGNSPAAGRSVKAVRSCSAAPY